MALSFLKPKLLGILFPILWILNGCRLGFFRVLLVFGVRKLASLLGVRLSIGGPLLIAVCLEAIFSHYWDKGSNSGRILYTLAVGGGLFWRKTLRHTHLSLATGSWLLVALWEVAEFQSLSLFTPIFSLLSVPILCTFTYPALLFAVFLSPTLCLCLAHLTTALISFLASLALLPGNIWIFSPHSLGIGLFFASLLACFRMKFYIEFKVGLLIVLLLVGARAFQAFNEEKMLKHPSAQTIKQLNVGQGDSAWVSLGSQKGLIDTGSFFSLTEEEWFQIFAHLQTRELSWIFLTHLDEDHAGGLAQLAKIIPIQEIFFSEKEASTPKRRAFRALIRSLPARKSSHSFWFPKFSLSPEKTHSNRANAFMNAVVIPLTPSGSYINLGDATHSMEDQYLNWLDRLSLSRPIILKLSHHGSKHSSSSRFLKKLSPERVWISCGYHNRYRHPHPELLERLKALNFKVERTDLNGDLTWMQTTTP